jgi:hypothetical protein
MNIGTALQQIPAKLRSKIYIGLMIVGAGLGATQAAYLAIEAPTPTWLKGLLAGFGFLAATGGLTAKVNVTPELELGDPDEIEEEETP